jgi:beta-phosphoglucomutase family hydrolase
MAKFKAVIFDMDGVLIDSEPLHVKVETAMFNELNIPLSQNMYSRFAGTTSLSMWNSLVEEFHIDKKPEELAFASNNRFIDELKNSKNVTLFEGVVDVLENLKKKNISVALASSSSIDIVNVILDRFNLRTYFNAIVTGTDVKHSKPHPEIFLLAAKRLNIPPSDCIVVEDSTNGVLAAKYAGIHCVGFKPAGNKHELTEASRIIKSFREFDLKVLRVN